MIKRVFTIIFATLLCIGLIACNNEQKTPNDNRSKNNAISNVSETSNSNVEKISVSDLLHHSTSPESDFFCDEGKDGGLVLIEYLGNDEIVVIPETINGKPITTIRQYVFSNNSSVKAIKLSSSVKKIDKMAFALNKSLQIVICGESLEEIGESTFQGCKSLYHVELNDCLKFIDHIAFSGCTSLKSIVIPSSVETIETFAFASMSEDFTIMGEPGSVAETYANMFGYNFEAK